MVRVRNEREIDLIAESCQIVADTLDMLTNHIKPGAVLLELDSLAEDFIRSKGARPAFKGYMGFPATLCISIDEEVVHGIPAKRTLQEGQIVGIDCGAEKKGYYGDSARTFAVGEISTDKKKLMDVTKESLMIGIEKAKPGNYVSDIGHAIQTFVEAEGFSVVRELVGHGIGTSLHEDPQVPNYGVPKQGYKLQEGMCLAIEPMINLGEKEIITDRDGWTIRTKDGKSSAHFEHTIAILSEGPKILTMGNA
ncbi:MAG TPA: type I methionyl aminopeptidase [Candidatus Marinimicrobia bacterium]|jgi:methionyl aminopeptidase|nr:type I methionyl aminopeptidase [Candidatus Neomarinimicrobiota bacterium]MDP6229378.1 type I methionyl aminopeptidase [Candidatus Neomarinimicrobiota bacterium]MDP7095196.1 type I methionyl aminopeptidase [Candidatus Neomarinimicrobiota bacterium]MDP7512483.1 type I methionyl aminopeptidase [Candidatus Neomarinimicrobiota bacterium]HBR86289.1 type I methionyl aminopeptidase [Candidatus Neomarinimicrobiota bacterium]|tara:strand:+ start:4613 stop:5365 length:753 start_codon:yes stop_codon:yes gene_type:complete